MERELDALQAERNSLAAQKTSQDEKITRLEFELSSKQLKYDNLVRFVTIWKFVYFTVEKDKLLNYIV